MNFKVTLMMSIALSLAACGPHKSIPNTDTPPIAGLPNAKIDEPTLEPNITSDVKVDDISTHTTQTSQESVDILDRIRAGFAFPALNNKNVRQHERWASEHPSYLSNLFGRAEPFLYFIVEEIERRGLPMELALLPAIESAYDPGAVSRSRAAGLWQFVPATGKGFGLRQDWWYDGRHDPYSSTFAALDYLEQLHKMFNGDWFIALAAYNAGPGTLRREIKRAKSKGRKTDYVNLKLRLETRRYVPKLMALKHIVQNPSKYNMSLPAIASEPYFEVLELPGQIDLVEFAKTSKLDQQLLRHLNRGFKRWATPPEGPHRLLIPLSFDAEKTRKNIDYARVTVKNSPKLSYRNHEIKKGDTLSAIARTYGVSVSALRSTNRLQGNNIQAGKNLMIPLPGQSSESSNASLSKSSPTLSLPKSRAATSNEPRHADQNPKIKHRVAKGDTLWSIARRYHVDLKALMDWNNLRSDDILNLNQLLTVFVN